MNTFNSKQSAKAVVRESFPFYFAVHCFALRADEKKVTAKLKHELSFLQWQFWTASLLHRLRLRLTELVAKEEQKREEGKYGPNGAKIQYNSSADAKLEKELDLDANKHAGGKGRRTAERDSCPD